MRDGETFLNGLRDKREVWYRGERVDDVVEHDVLGTAARHVAADFDLQHDPLQRSLAVTADDGGRSYSTFWHVPRSSEDLIRRSRLIEASTAHGATLVSLAREIGSDAAFALRRVLAAGTPEAERASAFYQRCREEDLAVAVAQTDVKGDRSQRPAEQADPDVYLRIVDRRPDGIVVRGAKAHTSCAPYVDELVVIPTRALAADERDWAVAFAIPVATPGLKLLCSDYLHTEDTPWTRPISATHKMIETLTVFDDVFVPWERVFLDGRPELAGRIALTFVEYHRFTAVSYKLPLLDALVGVAIALAEANGISRAGHVRDKLTWLIGYAETVRGLAQLAATRARIDPATGVAYPDPLTTNLAKWTFAREYARAVEHVTDIAGGLLVTGPGDADWASPELRPYFEKYFSGAAPAEERLALLNLASELTARDYAGYQSVLAVHAEGSLEAEKLMLHRSYDPRPALDFVRRLTGIAPRAAQEVTAHTS
jgi:4-hydroxybutyryl-CoA dehydratase/vinylacetyl-CoA-Delta-isomerase